MKLNNYIKHPTQNYKIMLNFVWPGDGDGEGGSPWGKNGETFKVVETEMHSTLGG